MNEIIEDVNIKRKRLSFRSWHRGTREIDLILGRFADENLKNFTEEQLDVYDDILVNNDPDLYNWITGKDPVPKEYQSDVMDLIVKFSL